MERKFDNRSGYHAKREPETEDEALTIEGRRAVTEALRSGRSINKLYYADGELEGSAHEILALARDLGVVAVKRDRRELDRLSVTGHHQGFIALAAPFDYTPFDELVARAGENGLIIILDGVSDVHNLGSVIRTAVCVGASGVVIPKHRAACVNAAVMRTSVGAAEYLPVARVTNIADTIDALKDAGYWISGAAMDGESMYSVDLTGRTALVIGSEGEGMSRLVREKCDRLISIPQTGVIDSLNASVAAAVLMYEAYRQRK